MMILLSILIPFISKQMISEFVSVILFLSIPLIWSSWDLPTPMTLGLMVDKLSIFLILLTLWVCMLMLYLKVSSNYLKMVIVLLMLSLVVFFSVSSFMLLFITFEVSLIPTLCLIMGWGYQPERLEASYYFVFYTITLSMPLMISLIWLSMISGEKYLYMNDELYSICKGGIGFYILLVFMIKLPLFMVHLWLPKAHVEAPVVGSMILAGILLKTGGYGIVRVFMYMSSSLVKSGFKVLGFLGMVYICMVCMCCADMKQLIAFSSVSHMNFMVVGLMNNSVISYSGCVIMMVSHGICSSLMFMLVDFSYNRLSSRSIILNKGLLTLAPSLSLFWSLAMMFNMGVPPSAGSISELLVILGSKSYSNVCWNMMFAMYLFLSAFYSAYLYMSVNHGTSKSNSFTLNVKETLMSVSHLMPLTSLVLMVKFLSV